MKKIEKGREEQKQWATAHFGFFVTTDWSSDQNMKKKFQNFDRRDLGVTAWYQSLDIQIPRT